MTTHQAVRFAGDDIFVDFVRQYGRPEAQGAYELYVCREPGDASGAVLYLVRRDARLPTNPAWPTTKIGVADGTLTDGRAQLDIIATTAADRLPALVGPAVVNEDHESPTLPRHVVFWARSNDSFQRLVTHNFRLGCDRLQVALVRTTDSRQAYLVRAERPSFFVVDAAQEDAEIEVYDALAGGSLLVPWGTTHPLVELWQGGRREGETVFMQGVGAGAARYVLQAPEWTDIYGLLDFQVEGATATETWSPATETPARFVVPLHMVPSHTRRQAVVWMLPGSDQPRLEQLLRLIPDQDLAALQFTAQRAPDGQTWLFVRERITGAGRQHIDFSGRELAPWAGYPNLLLPTDQELEPPLRKDRYRDLFGLRPGEITILWRDAGDQLRVSRLRENAFRPLPELVDYIIGTGAETLEALVAQAKFSFMRLENPPRPVKEAPTKAPGVEQPIFEERDLDMVPLEDEPEEEPARPAEELVLPDKTVAVAAPVPSALVKREAEIETALVKEQSLAAWRDLASVKAALDKPHEASVSLKEALWLTFEEDTDPAQLEGEVLQSLIGLLDKKLPEQTPVAQLATLTKRSQGDSADTDWIWLLIGLGAQHIEADIEKARGSGDLRRWLLDCTERLERRSADLRTKDRWLMWGRMLRVSGDAIAEAKIREALLDELTQSGLTPRDTPAFIQNRIYQSRFLDDDSDDVESEAHYALGIVEAIGEEFDRAEDAALKRISAAILGYAFERLGARNRSNERIQEAESYLDSGTGLTVIEQAWIALYLAATAELRSTGTGRAHVERYNELMRAHKAADLARSELEVIQRNIFRRSDAESPTEFFSPDNFRTLFPQSGNYVQAQKIKNDLEELLGRGNFAQALSSLQDLAKRAAAGNIGLDPRQFAWLLNPIVEILRKIGQVVEGTNILKQLEQGVEHQPTRSMMGLYTTLLRLKVAEGYIELGEESRGVELIQNVVRNAWKSRELQWLDHLDMLGAALEAIEVAPIQRRMGPATEILSALFISHKHPTDSLHYRPIKLRLIDHCVEVALSKEKLSLKRYKSYLDQDEFHVRLRVVREKLS